MSPLEYNDRAISSGDQINSDLGAFTAAGNPRVIQLGSLRGSPLATLNDDAQHTLAAGILALFAKPAKRTKNLGAFEQFEIFFSAHAGGTEQVLDDEDGNGPVHRNNKQASHAALT